MIQSLVSDFSNVVLLSKDKSYSGGLNALYKKLSAQGEYDFFAYFQFNRDLLDFYKTLSKDIDLYLFTSEYIQEHPLVRSEIDGMFKEVFSGARLGLIKTHASTYKTIADIIGKKSEEILFIDDRQENIDAARDADMAVIRYESNNQTIREIRKKLPDNMIQSRYHVQEHP